MIEIYNQGVKDLDLISKCKGFDWDPGNIEKNWIAHNVTPAECEQIFFNLPFIVAEDVKHSQNEERYYALGSTDADRELFLIFTVRGFLIRVISARDMSKKERKVYRDEEENTQ